MVTNAGFLINQKTKNTGLPKHYVVRIFNYLATSYTESLNVIIFRDLPIEKRTGAKLYWAGCPMDNICDDYFGQLSVLHYNSFSFVSDVECQEIFNFLPPDQAALFFITLYDALLKKFALSVGNFSLKAKNPSVLFLIPRKLSPLGGR